MSDRDALQTGARSARPEPASDRPRSFDGPQAATRPTRQPQAIREPEDVDYPGVLDL